MKYISSILLLCLAGTTYAQDVEIFEPSPIKKEIESLQIDVPIQIDGILDEAVWDQVKPSGRFTQVEPQQGEFPTQDTDIKVLYDERFLYLGVICHDSLGKDAIRATDFKRDFNFQTHDLINIGFDGFQDERNSMTIAVNPYGVQRDYLSFDALYYDIDWDGVWKVRTSITDSGWVAEIAVPWQTLRYPKTEEATQSWGFNLYRNRRLTNEISAFSPFPRSFSASRMDYAGRLTNLQPPPPKPNIRVQPYFLTSYDRYKNGDTEIAVDDSNIKIGGDIKWVISPNAVLDLTANTDFAQADVDRQVNNTTRFSVFFPERRQFFLENASLFAINAGPGGDGSGGSMRIQPFFSRTIGLDDQGSPIPLDAGGRFVYRSAKRNYGAMAIRQRGDSLQDPTHFIVGRFSENIGKQNRLGGLVTMKQNGDDFDATVTIDGFIRVKEAHSINTMLSFSNGSNVNGGFSGIAQYYYSTNQWKAWWTQSIVSQNYNPEMGFISRTNVIGTTPGIIRYFRGEKLPFKKWLRAFEPSLNTEFYHEASSGQLIERQIKIWPFYLNFQNGGYFGYGLNAVFQNLTNTFSPLGVVIPIGKYNYLRHSFLASTDPSKILSLTAFGSLGDYFDGKLGSIRLQAQFVPVPHFSLRAQFNRNHFEAVGQDNISKNVDLFSIEGRFALNPRLQLIGFYQNNSEGNASNYNIRLSWEYQPLSFVYIVFNHREFDDFNQTTQLEDHVIAKVSLIKQF